MRKRAERKEDADMQKEELYWIGLSQIKGLTIQDVETMQKEYGSIQAIWEETNVENFRKHVRKPIFEQLEKQAYKKQLEHIVTLMSKHQVECIHYKQKAYPKLLKHIHSAPAILYLKGNKEILNTNSIAIVGARNATDYGKRIAKEMAEQLAQRQITIISGLAKGIDTKAHQGALQANGNTIAIVAGGVDYIYPPENAKLQAQILNQGGAILSENGILTKPEKQDFPKRNRLISGMSKGILVVEAAEKSGSSITVDFALAQGREVFAIPGNITSEQSKGTNRMIQEGAKCVMRVEDILEEI